MIQAFVDNKKLLFDNVPTDEGVTFAYQLYRYRIAPEPKLRPWESEEVPLGAIIRRKGARDRRLITEVWDSQIREHWCEEAEHSTDGGKTWHPCGVMEEQQ